MNDAGHPIQIDIQSAPISCFEQAQGAIRYNLGYISGEFSQNYTSEDLFVRIWFKRGLNMEWENIRFKLNSGRKVFRQKLPAGLTVTTFYAQLYGWIAPQPDDLNLNADFEITDFELSIKEIPVGKHAGEPLGLDTTSDPPPPPVILPFEMFLDMVGEVGAISARAVWYTTHPATTRVIYGDDPLAMIQTVEDLTFTEYHDIMITGLTVGKYYYAQFFSISQITGEEINSDIKAFFTDNELTITNILTNPIAALLIKQKNDLYVDNVIGDTDYLLTLEPDGDGEIVAIGAEFSAHTKVEIEMANIIGNEFETLLS